MRCLSTVQLLYRARPWSGPLSRELLVFNSFVKALSRSLRHLFEAISIHMILRGDARKVRDDYVDIALSLPFQSDVNTGFGILAKTYIDATIAFFGGTVTEADLENPKVKESKEQAIGVVEETFVIVKNAKAEIERGFRFWDAVSTDKVVPDIASAMFNFRSNRLSLPCVSSSWSLSEVWQRTKDHHPPSRTSSCNRT